MAVNSRFLSSVFVLVLLLAATTEMGPMVAEARICQSASHSFRGPCLRKSNCAAVCHGEGFPDGDCSGFRRRCFCARPC